MCGCLSGSGSLFVCVCVADVVMLFMCLCCVICVFVCLFACFLLLLVLFACVAFVRIFVVLRMSFMLYACWFGWLGVCMLACLFVRRSVCPLGCRFVCLFVCSCVCVFVWGLLVFACLLVRLAGWLVGRSVGWLFAFLFYILSVCCVSFTLVVWSVQAFCVFGCLHNIKFVMRR